MDFAILPAQRHLVGNSFIVQCRDLEAAKESTCCREKLPAIEHPVVQCLKHLIRIQYMHDHGFDHQLPNAVLVTYKNEHCTVKLHALRQLKLTHVVQ